MRSVERRFKECERKSPLSSSFIAFSRAIAKQEFSEGMICRYFNKLVEKSDYSIADKKIIIQHLMQMTGKVPEENKKSGISAVLAHENLQNDVPIISPLSLILESHDRTC